MIRFAGPGASNVREFEHLLDRLGLGNRISGRDLLPREPWRARRVD